MLAMSSLLLATSVSLAVINWFPRPAPPQMRLDHAVQALKTTEKMEGLRVSTRDAAPVGNQNLSLTTLAAARLELPVDHVRLVFGGGGRIADIQIITDGIQGDSSVKARISRALESVLTSIQLPSFELGMQQTDGRWRVVSSDHSDLAAWRLQVVIALLGGTALLAPLAAWAATRLGRPLMRLAEASATVDLQATIALPDDGPREVKVLAEAINAGRIRLRTQAQEMTRMLAAVAHDLRTPLTSLRLRAEFAPPAQAKRMISDIERMSTMISQVLDYARGELEPPSMELLDLTVMLQDCVQSARLRGVDVKVDVPESLSWHVDALLLHRALDNLIDNASRFAGTVELRVSRSGDQLQLCVADRGPGIPAADRARLLQPFQRIECSRSRDTGGAGLGLAVAANAARRHGGELELIDREGGGLIACMRLRSSAPTNTHRS